MIPKLNEEQLAKIYFSFSYSKTLDVFLFDNLIYFLEKRPLN